MGFIKNNFQFLVILALFGVILFQRIGGTSDTKTPQPVVITVVDTSWKHLQQPVTNVYPTVTNRIPYTPGANKGTDTMYLPSPVDSILRLQYKALRDSLLAINVYKQTLKYDSSSVTLTDSISQNKIVGRSYSFDLKYPVITSTTTIKEPYKPVNQLYIGGGLLGNPSNLVGGVEASILFKNKKDQMYKAGVIQQLNGTTFYEVGTYWKIKLRK